MLGCIQPMSSPMMKRMFGCCGAGAGVVIFSCATAGATVPTAAMPTARSAANAVDKLNRLSFVLSLRLTPEEDFTHGIPHVMELPRQRSFSLRPAAIKRLRRHKKCREAMQITSLKLMPIVGPCRRFYWQLLSSVRPRLRALAGVRLRGCARPSLALGVLLDWRHCSVDLVVILHHQSDIGRKFHGLWERFQF